MSHQYQPLLPNDSRLHVTQPFPSLPNDAWVYRPRPKRWPWVIIAMLLGSVLAALLTDGKDIAFFKKKSAQSERTQSPSTLAITSLPVNAVPDKTKPTETNKDVATILQVNHTGPFSQEQQPKPFSSDLTSQTAKVRLPPLSVLKIYFPKPFSEAPQVKLAGETQINSDVSIEEITAQFVVIRNANATSECSFRYHAEGNLKTTVETSP